MSRRGRRSGRLALVIWLATPLAVWAEGSQQPAELPPASYAGQQYVDSTGCVFLRAGAAGETLWIPRVTSGGKQICGYPPSGNRVAVEGEAGAETGMNQPDADQPVADQTPYFVAMGSFGFASNVRKAKAAGRELGFEVSQGKIDGGEQGLTTVFVGPFVGKAAAIEAAAKLRKAGYPDAMLVKG